MQIIPAIDLKNGQCVRLTQGRKSDVTIYDTNPVRVAGRFAEAGAQTIHVVDLDAAFAGGSSLNRSVLQSIIASMGVPIEFGGGIRSARDVEQLIDLGVARVVVGTIAAESPELLGELAAAFGRRVCVGIDARDGEVMTRGWEQGTKITAVELARRIANAGIERIIYTDVARDGMLSGLNLDETRAVAQASGVRITASGGISSLHDLECLVNANEPLIDSVIVGKALYEGKFTLAEAQRILANADSASP